MMSASYELNVFLIIINYMDNVYEVLSMKENKTENTISPNIAKQPMGFCVLIYGYGYIDSDTYVCLKKIQDIKQ